MFRKKSPSVAGRQRPLASGDRQKTAVFSYHANRSVSPDGATTRYASGQPPNGVTAATRRNKPVNWFKRGSILAGLIGLSAVLGSNILLSTKPVLDAASSNSTGKIFLRDLAVYSQAAEEVLAKSIFNHTKVTISTTRIGKELSNQFPELGRVSVALPLIGRVPVVHLEAATPAALLATSDGQVYVLDTAGRALITANHAPAVAKLRLPLINDQSNLTITAGKVALPSSTVAFITEVTGQLKAQKLTIDSLTLPQGTSELDVKVSGAPYIVKFNVMGEARAEAGTFLAVKQQLEREHKTPTTYIDVRAENRAYYK